MYGKVKVNRFLLWPFLVLHILCVPTIQSDFCWMHQRRVYLTIVCACLPREVTPSSLSSHSQTWLLFTSIMTGTMSSWQLIVGFWWEVINSTSGRVLASVQVRACVKIATKQLSWRLMGKDHVLPKEKVKISLIGDMAFFDCQAGILDYKGYMCTGLWSCRLLNCKLVGRCFLL